MSFLDRFRRTPPAEGPVAYTRLEIPYKRLAEPGWPRSLQRVRKVLPEHLHDSPPSAAARYGSWIVVAKAGRTPVGLAWTIHTAGDPAGAYIEEVAVLESHQRRGIGTELLRETARWMAELGRPKLSILPMTGSGWVAKAGFTRAAVGNGFEADARRVAGPQRDRP